MDREDLRFGMYRGYLVFNDGTVIGPTGNIKKFRFNTDGYLTTTMPHHRPPLHRLLAICFIPNPLNLDSVNHIDGNKLNNDLSNLEWISRSDNLKHAYKLGLMNPGRLRPPMHPSVKQAYLIGMGVKQIAEHVGNASHSYIRKWLIEQGVYQGDRYKGKGNVHSKK